MQRVGTGCGLGLRGWRGWRIGIRGSVVFGRGLAGEIRILGRRGMGTNLHGFFDIWKW